MVKRVIFPLVNPKPSFSYPPSNISSGVFGLAKEENCRDACGCSQVNFQFRKLECIISVSSRCWALGVGWSKARRRADQPYSHAPSWLKGSFSLSKSAGRLSPPPPPPPSNISSDLRIAGMPVGCSQVNFQFRAFIIFHWHLLLLT